MNEEEKEAQDRLIEATAALLENAPGRRMQITNLNKALFYLDLAALRDTGHTITKNVYVALPQGPVMNGYKEQLVRSLSTLGVLRQDDDGMGKPVVLRREVESYHYMDDHLRGLAATVAATIARRTAAAVSKISHENPGWRIAFARGQGKGAAPAPINLRVALQQISGDDDWLDQPADEELQSIFAGIDGEAGEPW